MKIKLPVKAKQKALKAPSSTSSGKKKLAPFKPKAVKEKPVKPAKISSKLDNFKPDKKKQKKTQKAVKTIAAKPWGANPKRDQILHANYMEYLKTVKRPRWGNGDLDPDSKGFDGYDSLRLLNYAAKQLKIKPKQLEIDVRDKVDKKVSELLTKCAIYNVWQWSNFCTRVWTETLTLDPPIRRIVNVNLSDIFPVGDINLLVNRMRDNADAKQAFANLGHQRYKVRLLLTLTPEQELKPKTLYALYDMMQFTTNNNSIWGMCLNTTKELSYFQYPRETVILQPNNLRKSREAEQYLDTAIEAGYRVILPFDLVKGNLSSVKEIKQSHIYSKLLKSWKGLSPLITLPNSSKMVKVAKVSKLSDILLV